MSRLRLKTMKLPKYVQAWFDKRDSRAYYYFRRRGFSLVRLPGLPWSPSFMAAYEAALSGPRTAIGAGRIKPGQRGRRRCRVFRLATILRLEESWHATDAPRHP